MPPIELRRFAVFVLACLPMAAPAAKFNFDEPLIPPDSAEQDTDLDFQPLAPVRQGFFHLRFETDAARVGDMTDAGSFALNGDLNGTMPADLGLADAPSAFLTPWDPARHVLPTPWSRLQEAGAGAMSLQGGLGVDWGRDRFSIPLFHQENRFEYGRYRKFDALGVEWQRRLDSKNLVSLSAQFSEFVALDQGPRDTSSTAAALGWSSEFSGSTRPRLSGSIYLGDETPKDEAQRFFGRRFYGFVLDGRFTPFQNHTPYASLRFQRSDYEWEDPQLLGVRREDYSSLAAGWSWQVLPHWGMRAEANYSLNDSTVELYDYDRMQFFFSTRFDFR